MRPNPARVYSTADSNFNPRTRTGCDAYTGTISSAAINISIHAPARGATDGMTQLTADVVISIHAPARGATPLKKRSESSILISIHAPARGATCGQKVDWSSDKISIHAPARGATFVTLSDCCTLSYFNPRTRTGCDNLFLRVRTSHIDFNPRTRTGCDTTKGATNA